MRTFQQMIEDQRLIGERLQVLSENLNAVLIRIRGSFPTNSELCCQQSPISDSLAERHLDYTKTIEFLLDECTSSVGELLEFTSEVETQASTGFKGDGLDKFRKTVS